MGQHCQRDVIIGTYGASAALGIGDFGEHYDVSHRLTVDFELHPFFTAGRNFHGHPPRSIW